MKPTVTQLTKLLDKPALLYWANKIGLQGIRLSEYRKKSLSKGASLHKQIENHILYGLDMDKDADNKNCIDFLRDKEVVGVELKIETEWFTGRYDLSYIDNDQKYIIDFKTGQTSLYLENILQLVAYKMADGADKIAIVSIPSFSVIPIDIDDFVLYENIIIHLSKLWHLINEHEDKNL